MDIHSELPYSNRDVMDSNGDIRPVEDFADTDLDISEHETKRLLELDAIDKYEEALAIKEGPAMQKNGRRYNAWVSLVCGARRSFLESRDIWMTKEPDARASSDVFDEFQDGVAMWSLYREGVLRSQVLREQRRKDLEDGVAEPLSRTVK